MSAPNPIQGVTTLKAGSQTTFTDTTPGGAWSSSNTAIATVGASTGVVTAVAAGSTQIIYTVGSNSTAINITVLTASSLTNGFDFNTLFPALQLRVLFRSQGLVSDSNRYYEDFHTLCDTMLIDSLRPQDGTTLAQYLQNKQSAVIMEMLNAVYNHPQVIDKPKLAFYRSNMPLPIQLVENTGQFVGLRLFVGKGDHAVKLNSVSLFFSEAVSFNLYLYNDFFLDPVMTIPVTANGYEVTITDLGETVILNNLVPTQYKGGTWYLGYWQEDLGSAQAVYYPCGYNKFRPVDVMAFSATEWTDPNGSKNFQRNNIGANNLMYGLNLELSTYVDATNTIYQNAHLLDELNGLLMAKTLVRDMVFSYRSGGAQRAIQGVPEMARLYAELNGHDHGSYGEGNEIPYVLGLSEQVNREIKRVKAALQKNCLTIVG